MLKRMKKQLVILVAGIYLMLFWNFEFMWRAAQHAPKLKLTSFVSFTLTLLSDNTY